MDIKSFLRGFGGGIVLTTVILGITFHIIGDNNMTEDQIRKAALDLGYVESSKEEDKLDLILDEEKKSNEAVTPTVEEQTTKEDPEEVTTKEETTKEDTSQEETTEKKTIDKTKHKAKVKNEKIQIEITSGMPSATVANLLEQKGVIDDSSKFIQFLNDGSYTNRILIGIFELQKNMNYYDVVKILTKN